MSFFSNFLKYQVQLKPLSLDGYCASLSLLTSSRDQYTSTKEPLLSLSSAMGSVELLSAVSSFLRSLSRVSTTRLVLRVFFALWGRPAHSSAELTNCYRVLLAVAPSLVGPCLRWQSMSIATTLSLCAPCLDLSSTPNIFLYFLYLHHGRLIQFIKYLLLLVVLVFMQLRGMFCLSFRCIKHHIHVHMCDHLHEFQMFD